MNLKRSKCIHLFLVFNFLLQLFFPLASPHLSSLYPTNAQTNTSSNQKLDVAGPSILNMQVNTFDGVSTFNLSFLYYPNTQARLDVILYHYSSVLQNTGFGRGWIFNYNALFRQFEDRLEVKYLAETKSYAPDVVASTTTYAEIDGKFVVQAENGLFYHFNPAYQYVEKVSDGKGNDLIFTYDSTWHVTQIDAPALYPDAPMTLTYNVDGDLVKVVGFDGQETNFEVYRGKLAIMHLPNGMSYSFFYDAAGKLVEVSETPDGFMVQAGDAGNIRAQPDGEILGRLDANGRALAVGKNEAGNWIFVFLGSGLKGWVSRSVLEVLEGELDSLPVVTEAPAPFSYSLAIEYGDGVNTIRTIANGKESVVVHTYDTLGGITKVETGEAVTEYVGDDETVTVTTT